MPTITDAVAQYMMNARTDQADFVQALYESANDDKADDVAYLQRVCLRAILEYCIPMHRSATSNDELVIGYDGLISVRAKTNRRSSDGLVVSFIQPTISRALMEEEDGNKFVLNNCIGVSWNVLKHIIFSLGEDSLRAFCATYRAHSPYPSRSGALDIALKNLNEEMSQAPTVNEERLDDDDNQMHQRLTNITRTGCALSVLVFFGAVYLLLS